MVQRGIRLVTVSALHRVGGDARLARDVTPLVFIDPARQVAKNTAGLDL